MLKRSRRNLLKFQMANHNLALIRITGKLLGTFTAQNFELLKNMPNNTKESQLEREAIRVLLEKLLPALAQKGLEMATANGSNEKQQGCVGTACVTALSELMMKMDGTKFLLCFHQKKSSKSRSNLGLAFHLIY